MNRESKRVKKIIKFSNLIIKLYRVKPDEIYLPSTATNIEAFDQNGNLLWRAGKPEYEECFWDMQIDEQMNFLEADGNAGQKYHIDLSNGHIFKSYIVK